MRRWSLCPPGGTFTNSTALSDISNNNITQAFQLNVLTLGGVGSSTATDTATIKITGNSMAFVNNGASGPVLNLNAKLKQRLVDCHLRSQCAKLY